MANTFSTPQTSESITLARSEWNSTLESLGTNFYGPAHPDPGSYKIEGANTNPLPNGLLWRSSRTNAFYVVDSVHQKGNPIYGQSFTRAGISHRFEEALTGVAHGTYEIGELFAAGFSAGNVRLYIISSNAQNASAVKDVGIPPSDSVTATMLQTNSITTVKITDRNVTNVKIAAASVTNNEIAANTVTGAKIEPNTIDTTKISGQIAVADGGTGAATAADARTNLGLGSLATKSTVGSSDIDDNAVTLADLEHGTQGDILYYAASGAPTRLSAGTSGQFLKTQGAAANPTWAGNSFDLFHVREQQASGTTTADTASGGTFDTRTLNTSVVNSISGASLASNQITLPAGTYDIHASALSTLGRHKIRLRNITDTSTTLVGQSAFTATTGTETRSTIVGRFTIADTKVFEIQHYTQSAGSHSTAVSSGEVEVWTEAMIWKVG